MKSPLLHLAAALALCVIVLTGYGVWYATVSNKSVAVTALENKITTITTTVERAAATRVAFADIAGDEAVVQDYFVPETGVVSFISNLEDRGNALGTVIHVLSVAEDGTASRPTLALSLSVSGTFDAVMRTVGAIEYAAYDISVASLSVSRDTEGDWLATLKLFVGSIPTANTATTTP